MAQQRNHAGLPVIRVNDVRPPVDEVDHVENCTLEECEPFAVIFIAVQAVTLEIVLVLDEVVNDTVNRCGIIRRRLIDPSGMDLNRSDPLQLVVILLDDLFIQRDDNTRIMTALYQRIRKTCHNVRKSAGLDERKRLTAHKQNRSSHRIPPVRYGLCGLHIPAPHRFLPVS